MLRRQVGLHMLKYPYVFERFVSGDLEDESYVSFVSNVFYGNVWGDEVVAGAIAHMWNLPISFVIPPVPGEIKLFHNTTADVVVVGNGGPLGSPKENTHFSATRSSVHGQKIPGHSLKKTHLKISKLVSAKAGHYASKKRNEKSEEVYLLRRLRNANHRMSQLDSEFRIIASSSKNLVKGLNALMEELTSLSIDVKGLKKLKSMDWLDPYIEDEYGELDPGEEEEQAEAEEVEEQVQEEGETPMETETETLETGVEVTRVELPEESVKEELKSEGESLTSPPSLGIPSFFGPEPAPPPPPQV